MTASPSTLYDIRWSSEAAVPGLLLRTGEGGRPRVDAALGLALPDAGGVAVSADLTVLPRASDEWFARVADTAAERALLERIDEALGHGLHGAVARAGAALACLRLEGDDLAEVFAQLSPMDLDGAACDVGKSWVGAFGRSPALYHRCDSVTLDVYVEAPLLRYGVRLVEACAGA